MPVATAYRPPTAFSLVPPVIKNLLIINALAFFAQQIPSVAGAVEQYGMLWPAGAPDVVRQGEALVRVPDFYPWQLLTSAFLHGSFSHILFNMFGLWIFGMRIENVLGSRRFLTFYIACVLGASVLQLLVTSYPFWAGDPTAYPVPTLGASGGVLGVLAAFGLLYPDEPIYLYFLFPIPAKWLVLGYAAFDLFAGATGAASGVAHFAHVGGMITGALLIQFWRGRIPFAKPRRLA